MSVNDIMYISLNKYLYWGKGESLPFPTPSPALPKSLFAWQMMVGVLLSRVVVVVDVDQLSMSCLSCTCKQNIVRRN